MEAKLDYHCQKNKTTLANNSSNLKYKSLPTPKFSHNIPRALENDNLDKYGPPNKANTKRSTLNICHHNRYRVTTRSTKCQYAAYARYHHIINSSQICMTPQNKIE